MPESQRGDREDWSVPAARRRNLVATSAPEDLGWLVANQYQISIGWEAPAGVTDADTELSKFTVYWDEGNAVTNAADVATWPEATKHGSPGDAGDGELAQADFAVNSYVDADSNTVYYWTWFSHTRGDIAYDREDDPQFADQ